MQIAVKNVDGFTMMDHTDFLPNISFGNITDIEKIRSLSNNQEVYEVSAFIKHSADDQMLVSSSPYENNGVVYVVKVAEISEKEKKENLVALKNTILSLVKRIANDKRRSNYGVIDLIEVSGWTTKVSEALDYTRSNNPSVCPNLIIESKCRGILLNALVNTILTKSKEAAYKEAIISGNLGKLKDAILLANSVDELNKIDINIGWDEI